MNDVDTPPLPRTPPVGGDLLRVLGAALEQSRASACITTADLDRPGPTIVYVNPAYCAMTGYDRDEVLGQSPRIMQGPLTDRAELDRLRRELAAGRPFAGETVNYRKDGQPFLINWRIDPVFDEGGTITHFLATQEDVTELRRAQQLLGAQRALDEALTGALTEATGEPEDLDRVVGVVAEATGELISVGAPAVSVDVELGARTWHAAVNAEGVDPGAPGTVQRPLSAPTAGVDGMLSVVELTPEELEFVDHEGLDQLAERATLVLAAAAEFERHRNTAVELQRSLLPRPQLDVDGLSLCARYEPGAFGAEVGGDWYDVIDAPERLVLGVGDVAGSGVSAAAAMGRLRLLTEMAVRSGAEIEVVLARLDRQCDVDDVFATMLLVELDRQDGTVRAASAGHPPPLRRRDGEASVLAVRPGPPLGMRGRPTPVADVDVMVGDLLLLYTDGVVERRDEAITAGLERVRAALAAAPADLPAACDDLLARLDDGHRHDDRAVLAARLDVAWSDWPGTSPHAS